MSDQENQYIQQRREKVQQYRESGTNPYPNAIYPNACAAGLHQEYKDHDKEKLEGQDDIFSLSGRIIAVRSFGKAGFIQMRDGSGPFQIFVQKANLSDEQFALYKNLDVGDFAWFEGPLFRTKTDELSIKARDLKLVTKAVRPLPEKWHGLTDVETRYRQRYVDLIANQDVKKVFKQRSQIIQLIREFFSARKYTEVETPMMHPIPGGAAAKPFVTHHNKLHMDLYLRIAPELYLKRLVVGGMERVFEINRNFRNEGISIQHNPEFTMLEFYQAYATYEDLMKLTEEMIGEVAKKVCGSNKVTYQETELDFSPPFQRYTMKESVMKVGGVSEDDIADREACAKTLAKLGGKPKSDHEGYGALLTEIFELTTEEKLIQPTFITEYPTEVSPLARRNDENPEVTDRFEFFVFGREIANGFSELNDPEDQAARFKAQVAALEGGDDEAMHFDADYINALEYGMPPTAGEGIGIDRLVMLLTNSASIRDVILFPQLKTRATD